MGFVILLIVLAAWSAVHFDWRGAVTAMQHANPSLLALALGLNLLSLALKGVRWWVCLRRNGPLPLSLVMRATFAGAAINNVVIAQGGEAARVHMIVRQTGLSLKKVAGALALERTLDGITYLVLLVVAAWTFEHLPAPLMHWRPAATVLLALGLIALLVLAVARRKLGATALVAFVLSHGAWALQVATYFAVASATSLGISLGESITAQLAVGLSFLVRATPGNLGVFQAVYAAVLHPIGVHESAAVATAILIQAVQTIPVTALGALLAPRLLLPGTGDS